VTKNNIEEVRYQQSYHTRDALNGIRQSFERIIVSKEPSMLVAHVTDFYLAKIPSQTAGRSKDVDLVKN
jgi:hypothetical protein